MVESNIIDTFEMLIAIVIFDFETANSFKSVHNYSLSQKLSIAFWLDDLAVDCN